MNKPCDHPNCFAPDVACHMGEQDWKQCDIWKASKGNGRPAEVGPQSEAEGLLFPWSGNSLGTVDLPFVAGRTRPTVIGVVGPHKAGKTTLLASWYLLLGQGHHLTGRCFSASYTLAGWESIAHSLRWEGPLGPRFPPHTSSRDGRSPGLLHAAFRAVSLLADDFLFADAPGEWFKRWAMNRDAEGAEGARWVSAHASVFLLVADCDALGGDSPGSARSILQLLLRRLAAERRERPIALVWAKSDVKVPLKVREALQEFAHRMIPDIQEFSVTVLPSEPQVANNELGFMELLEWVVKTPEPIFAAPVSAVHGNDPFLMYGRL